MENSDGDFARMFRDEARLATVEVIYHMPDHPGLLQEFLWQTLDIVPYFPRIHRFLDFWRAEIEATINDVRISAGGILQPCAFRPVAFEGTLH